MTDQLKHKKLNLKLANLNKIRSCAPGVTAKKTTEESSGRNRPTGSGRGKTTVKPRGSGRTSANTNSQKKLCRKAKG